MIFSLFLLLALSLVKARPSCPLFFGAYGKTMVDYPTPSFDFTYDAVNQRIEIEVTTVYDPTAALVIDFQPFTATRKSLSDAGICENRCNTSVNDWMWEMGDYSMCEEGGDNGQDCNGETTTCEGNGAYPPQANNWVRTYNDCNLVKYKYVSKLETFLDTCGSSFTGVREVKGNIEHYGNVFVTYVRPAIEYYERCDVRDVGGALDTTCSSGFTYKEQQITFYIDDAITISSSNTCTDTSIDLETTASIQWTNNKIELNAVTLMPRPDDRGLLCSMTPAYQGPTELEVSGSKKECSCDIHCYTSAFCIGSSTEGKCEQTWTVQASGKFYPGMLDKGMYKLTWDVNNCSGYVAGLSECPSPPNSSCSSVLTVTETIKTFYEYVDPIKPFATLMLKQPPDNRFSYSFSDQDLKVWVRVTPLANGVLNTSSLEYCEAADNSLSCKGQWTKLQSWDPNAEQSKGIAEGNITISNPRDKVYLFRAISDSNVESSTILILDTHNDETSRLAPIPTTYVNVDRTICGNEGIDVPNEEDINDGFTPKVLRLKTIIGMMAAVFGLAFLM